MSIKIKSSNYVIHPNEFHYTGQFAGGYAVNNAMYEIMDVLDPDDFVELMDRKFVVDEEQVKDFLEEIQVGDSFGLVHVNDDGQTCGTIYELRSKPDLKKCSTLMREGEREGEEVDNVKEFHELSLEVNPVVFSKRVRKGEPLYKVMVDDIRVINLSDLSFGLTIGKCEILMRDNRPYGFESEWFMSEQEIKPKDD